jgi:hypothetical protein
VLGRLLESGGVELVVGDQRLLIIRRPLNREQEPHSIHASHHQPFDHQLQ